MKNRGVAHAHDISPWKIALRSMGSSALAMDAQAMASMYWLVRLILLPFRMLAAAGRFFDSLALAFVRGLARLCFGTLAMVILGFVLFALVRTVFHPWFR